MDASQRGKLIHKFAELLLRDVDYISVSFPFSMFGFFVGIFVDSVKLFWEFVCLMWSA